MTTLSATPARQIPDTHLVRDTVTVFRRELQPLLHDPFSLIFSLLQPVVFLGLFGPLLIGSSGETGPEVLAWFVPGILVMIALFGTSATGSNLLYEMQTGSHERTLVAPIARSALLVGRALKEMVPIIVQAVAIALVTIPFGFRPNLAGMALSLVLLAIFGMGLGALSYALALASRRKDWMFWAVQQALIFPLMILSGMLLPIEDGPAWMRVAASINPISHVVGATRALFTGDFGAPVVLGGFVAAIALAAAGLWVGITAMRRSS
jgi:ABC-2 type transport system permease protein